LLHFGCVDGAGVNRRRNIKFENISDLDSGSKILEKERSRSLKM